MLFCLYSPFALSLIPLLALSQAVNTTSSATLSSIPAAAGNSICLPPTYGQGCAAHDGNSPRAVSAAAGAQPFCYVDPRLCTVSKHTSDFFGDDVPSLAYSFTTCAGEDHYTFANVLRGETLRVAFEPVDTPWMRAAVASDGSLAMGRVGARMGFAADVFYRLQAEAGFAAVEVTATTSGYWWDSCVNDTIFGTGVDLCVGNIWATNDRTLRGALFTHPIAPRAALHILSANIKINMYAQLMFVFKPFSDSVWIVLVLCMCGFVVAMFLANEDFTAREEAWHALNPKP